MHPKNPKAQVEGKEGIHLIWMSGVHMHILERNYKQMSIYILQSTRETEFKENQKHESQIIVPKINPGKKQGKMTPTP